MDFKKRVLAKLEKNWLIALIEPSWKEKKCDVTKFLSTIDFCGENIYFTYDYCVSFYDTHLRVHKISRTDSIEKNAKKYYVAEILSICFPFKILDLKQFLFPNSVLESKLNILFILLEDHTLYSVEIEEVSKRIFCFPVILDFDPKSVKVQNEPNFFVIIRKLFFDHKVKKMDVGQNFIAVLNSKNQLYFGTKSKKLQSYTNFEFNYAAEDVDLFGCGKRYCIASQKNSTDLLVWGNDMGVGNMGNFHDFDCLKSPFAKDIGFINPVLIPFDHKIRYLSVSRNIISIITTTEQLFFSGRSSTFYSFGIEELMSGDASVVNLVNKTYFFEFPYFKVKKVLQKMDGFLIWKDDTNIYETGCKTQEIQFDSKPRYIPYYETAILRKVNYLINKDTFFIVGAYHFYIGNVFQTHVKTDISLIIGFLAITFQGCYKK